MVGFHGVQVALWVGVVVLATMRVREAFWRAPVDKSAFVDALSTAVAAGELPLAWKLADACRPAWAAAGASAVLAAADEREREMIVLELEQRCSQDGAKGVYALQALGRIAPPLAFIGVIVEVSVAFSGGEGLIALQRGLAASAGLERAATCFALGLATSVTSFAAAAALKRQARVLRQQVAAATQAARGGSDRRTPARKG